MYVTKKQIKEARSADLYAFLNTRFSNLFKKEGDSLRMISNHSISIKNGYNGYYDFGDNTSGNSIDFLVEHMNYSFVDAVTELTKSNKSATGLLLPEKNFNDTSAIENYMISRCIDKDFIKWLIREDMIYQSTEMNNLVFVSKTRDYAEIRGTLPGKPFHSCRKLKSDRFWSFKYGSGTVQKVYICEAAIDAISLMQIHNAKGLQDPSIYISIGGVGNQQTIDRIKSNFDCVVLAVDNDSAGEKCRRKNTDIEHLIPDFKDWNQDLCSIS